MRFSDSHKGMSPIEQHGIQLRMAADVLEGVTDLLDNDVEFCVFVAEDLLADIVAKNKLLQHRQLSV
jgi:hypothetical protein